MKRILSYPKNKIKVLLLENIDSLAQEILSEEGYSVKAVSSALSEEELIDEIKKVSIIGIRSKTTLSSEIINASPKLLAIGAFCIGTNQIDAQASALKGIPVFNAPYSNTRSVVELIIGEMLILSRKIVDRSQDLHAGVWNKSAAGCHELRGKKLGIIGYGNIGSQLSVLAENLGMEVMYYDTSDKLSLGNAKSCKTMKEVLKNADIVTIHVDGRSANTNLIGKKEFAVMKKGALFLNASRGFVVDIEALVAAITQKRLAGCAIDVFPTEPNGNAAGFRSPLQGLPNTILTPHMGAGTIEAQQNIARYVSSKLIQFVNTGSTTLSVNFPEIQMSEMRNVHRLIHIHQNVPGVLAKINNLLAQNKINIEGQYLKTNDEVGYVITDVNRIYAKEVVQQLREMKETIRVRVLY